MAVVAIFFFTLIWKDVKGLLSWQNFSIKKALVYVGITILFSTVVQLSVSWLNKSLFNDEFYYYFAFARFKYPLVLMISVIALMPAIFEELAYRGFLMGGLLKLLDARQAIFISSFLFALIHLSLISFFWLLPFALFLAYIRQKENTIWYGVLVHFVFNTLTCLIEYYSLFAS
jgi:membrane protease YdiL (CAAX protease family)